MKEMKNQILNGKQLREELNISTTVFYKWRKAGMPGHYIEGSRTFYILNEVLVWLEKAGYRKQKIWMKS